VDSSPFSARRATSEDLPVLEALWQQTGLPWDQLHGFLNEFQVATDESGGLAGAIGLLIEGSQALLHTEAVRADVEADAVRSSLWRRVQIVARNQGVQRIWTQEDAPYWLASGFAAATPMAVQQNRASFLDPAAAWFAFDLMDPARAQGLINEQLAILEAERMQSAESFQSRVRAFRIFAILMALLILGVCLWLLFRIFHARPDVLKRLVGG
jgi:N-acetylglutamate synthase-like GNAT family acetyltransferase